MKKSFRLLGMILALLMLVTYMPGVNLITDEVSATTTKSSDSSSKAETSAKETKSDTSSQDTAPAENTEAEAEFVPNFTFPEKLKAATITPGKDFFANPAQGADVTQKEINSIISNINSFQFNAIIVNTSCNNKAYYTSNPNPTPEENALRMLVKSAKDNNLFVYVNFNINFVLNEFPDTDLATRINYLTNIACRFSREYLADGIILDGYYSTKNVSNYDFYMKNGSGIGFENWLLENGAYVFSLVSESIHKTDNTIPVGICISNAWANSSSTDGGSPTNDTFQALKDGYSDTVNYLNKKYADFIMLNTTGSLTDASLPFKAFVDWWSAKAVASDIPLFVSHANGNIGTNATGWGMEDQVVKQLMQIEKVPKYQGSAFNSYSQLVSNTSSTGALIKYYNKTLDTKSLDKELEMNSPKLTNFTTYEPTIVFQGKFDKNFNVTINDKPLEINEAGYFYYEESLKLGLNTFVIKNKGKAITYNVTKKVRVLQSIEPVGQLRVDGGTTIDVSAIAYKGSVVTAKLNGKTITLTQTDGEWNGSDPNSNYAKFVGSFTTPIGKLNQEQNLGNIVINGNYLKSNYESLTGSNVIVYPLPDGVLPQTLLKITNGSSAKIFYADKTYEYPIPRTRLPAGTYDYYLKTVTYSGIDYYITQSGRRITANDATLIDGTTFGDNKIQFLNSSVQNYDTVMQFKLNKNAPIEIASDPCAYYSGSKGNFYINYQASSIKITFDYVNAHTNDVSLPANSLFSSATWSTSTDKNGRLQQVLTLGLKKTGGYSGVAPSYSADGTLTLRFNGHPNSLAGAVIAIDPGHGFTNPDKPTVSDSGANRIVTERDVNLAVAKLVEQKLRAAGATVYRLPTESKAYDTEFRADAVRQYKPDIFLSIHCNSHVILLKDKNGNPMRDAKGEPIYINGDGHGTEAYYFYPFSQPLAKNISSNVSTFLRNNAYSAAYDRGNAYNEFWVTTQQEFASSLVELDFVSYDAIATKLTNPSIQNGMADAIVNGMAQYLSNN